MDEIIILLLRESVMPKCHLSSREGLRVAALAVLCECMIPTNILCSIGRSRMTVDTLFEVNYEMNL